MDVLTEENVPYGDDWDSVKEVAIWAEEADRKRPWRSRIRDHIADRIARLRPPDGRILELGSGPGFLGLRVLERCPNLQTYTLLDFSEPMMAMSRQHLAAFPAARFVLASFKSDGWTRRLEDPFDCVVSMQAVHELRNKRHARRLYKQVFEVLAVPGLFLICDHTPPDNSPRSITLYMTEQEQQEALADARFANVHVELAINGLVVYSGERTN